MIPFPRIRPGDRQFSARAWNSVASVVEFWRKLRVGDGLNLHHFPHAILGLQRTPKVWGRIVSGTQPYTWEEVSREGGTWAVAATKRGGTDNAYESTGAADVEVGSVWRFYPGFGGEDWRFQAVRAGVGECQNWTLCVTVKDLDTEDPIPGATVRVIDGFMATVDECVANSEGVCCITLPDGDATYTVEAEATCYVDGDDTIAVVCGPNALEISLDPMACIEVPCCADTVFPETIAWEILASGTVVDSGTMTWDAGNSWWIGCALHAQNGLYHCVPGITSIQAAVLPLLFCFQTQPFNVSWWHGQVSTPACAGGAYMGFDDCADALGTAPPSSYIQQGDVQVNAVGCGTFDIPITGSTYLRAFYDLAPGAYTWVLRLYAS